ncbi:23S rRNA (adenine(1618)-N(6))-methyltransferase RlmF [Sphingobacterium sp. SGG-5]|uniref:23S rRNA (adenine(1618)-N(6))-methyltransferase RlmF n=1 Tax=Sphingobacterium sp. SGG-5 TaxID=2710881 RepID=UPI0013ECF50C|nr:23S rRNA (adenine(1618)-N(6))-methyltransferase RlmF [Sphingobacterium sp. SGG-5]NGM62257.1 23S rRNA (adenine(1618)-N(6))-methyltransferase RlmF [Sphingobacterium sp. SGG-5]
MANNKTTASKLHPRNKHQQGYNFPHLKKNSPNLQPFVFVNDFGNETIDFADPKAVFELNKALLLADYGLRHWELARNSLCPAVPGRADYIHYLADLLAEVNSGTIPTGPAVNVLDIGTGAGLIYPIIGINEYGWKFTATETDRASFHHAEINLNKNPGLKGKIQLRFQHDSDKILEGILNGKDKYDAILCNPPFYKSREENWQSSTKKYTALKKSTETTTVQNFRGRHNELWCKGGEQAFITKLIEDSLHLKAQLGWITSLVADKNHLKPLRAVLEYHKAASIKVVEMKQGNKTSRILAWRWS